LAEGEKSPDDRDAHLNCMRAVQDIGGHKGAVFGEDEGVITVAAVART
jgi:hypothetical protein